MSSKAIALSLALACIPALVAAQSAPPSPPASAAPAAPQPPPPMTPEQMRAHMRVFRRFHDQMQHLHASARAAILGALTPAHRALLARVVGDLAIAIHPNRDGAVRRLDAALSAHEKHFILNEGRYVKDQMHALMQQMKSQMMSMMTRAQRQGMMTLHGQASGTATTGGGTSMATAHGGMAMGMMVRHEHRYETPDAGRILLRFATNDHPPMMQLMMMRRHPR